MGLSNKEKEFILLHKDDMFPSKIAEELSHVFAIDNGGYRGKDTIKKAIKNLEKSV